MQLPCSFRKPAEYYSNSEEILNLFARMNKNVHIKFEHTGDQLKNCKLSVLRTKKQNKKSPERVPLTPRSVRAYKSAVLADLPRYNGVRLIWCFSHFGVFLGTRKLNNHVGLFVWAGNMGVNDSV
jgi:hypothetical protein